MTDLLIEIYPYLFGLLTIATSFYTLNKTIKDQREIKKIEIIKDLRISMLNDLIETYLQLMNTYNSLNKLSENMELFDNTTEWRRIYDKQRKDLLMQATNLHNKLKLQKFTTIKSGNDIINYFHQVYGLSEIVSDLESDEKEIEDFKSLLFTTTYKLEDLVKTYISIERTEIEDLITQKTSKKFKVWLKKDFGNKNHN